MALIDRLTRLLRADIHAVMDRIEDPQQLLRCAIRDMEDELQQLELQSATDRDRSGELRKALDLRRQRLVDLDGELDLAFAAGRDDLARAIVERKLATDLDARQMQEELERLAERISRSAALAAEREAIVRELRFKAGRSEAVVRRDGGRFDARFSDAEIDIALMREQHARQAP